MLTVPGFALAGSFLSRKHGLAAVIHDRLKWILVDQSPTTLESEWLCVDVDGYRIVNVYTVDLTAAYDTVWHRGLPCKLLRLLPDKHMVWMIKEVIRNRTASRSLLVTASKAGLDVCETASHRNRSWSPLLFNIYTYDLPCMTSQMDAYADDLALLYASRD